MAISEAPPPGTRSMLVLSSEATTHWASCSDCVVHGEYPHLIGRQ